MAGATAVSQVRLNGDDMLRLQQWDACHAVESICCSREKKGPEAGESLIAKKVLFETGLFRTFCCTKTKPLKMRLTNS